jgi:hypothetical protein
MIPVKHDNAPDNDVKETCCFCFKPTNYWNIKRDVACCLDCASTHKVADLPTKKQWIADQRTNTRIAISLVISVNSDITSCGNCIYVADHPSSFCGQRWCEIFRCTLQIKTNVSRCKQCFQAAAAARRG